MRALERQRALERERTRIARDIHVQVGTNLTKVGKLTEFPDRHFTAAEPHKPVLQTVADTTPVPIFSPHSFRWCISKAAAMVFTLCSVLRAVSGSGIFSP